MCYFCNWNIRKAPQFQAVRLYHEVRARNAGRQRCSKKVFLAFLFSDPDVGVQFLKNFGLTRSSMVCCKCGFQMSTLIVRTVTDDDVRGSHLLPPALPSSQSGTVSGFSRGFHEYFVPHVRHRCLVRTRSRARVGMWRHASIRTTGWGTKSITLPTIFSGGGGADPTAWTSSPCSSTSLQPY